MNLLKKFEDLTPFYFLIVIILIFGFLNKNLIPQMRWFSGILITIIVMFLLTIILKETLRKMKNISKKIKKDLDNKIKSSLNKEIIEKDYKKKTEICMERIILYEDVIKANIRNFYKSLLKGFFASLFSILFSFLPNYQIPDTSLFIFHLIYFLSLYGLYHVIRIFLILYETIEES